MTICDTILPRGGGADGRAPIFVPKDSWVIYTVYSMHRREDIFGEDAEDFRPERWENQRFTWVRSALCPSPKISFALMRSAVASYFRSMATASRDGKDLRGFANQVPTK